MFMCTNDFTLFKESYDKDRCPIEGCAGNLVRIDNGIARYISEINHVLKKRNFMVRALFCSSPKLPTVFRGFVEFTAIQDEKKVRRVEKAPNIFDLKRIVEENNDDQNEFVHDIIHDVLDDNGITDLSLTPTPLTIENLVSRSEDLPSTKGFRFSINPLGLSFVNSSIFGLSILCTISSSMFNLQLARLINKLHNM